MSSFVRCAKQKKTASDTIFRRLSCLLYVGEQKVLSSSRGRLPTRIEDRRCPDAPTAAGWHE